MCHTPNELNPDLSGFLNSPKLRPPRSGVSLRKSARTRIIFAKVGYVWALAWTLHQALSWSGRERALEQLIKYAGIMG